MGRTAGGADLGQGKRMTWNDVSAYGFVDDGSL